MSRILITVLILLDFINHFNTVDFDLLLAILGSLNISPKVSDWFHSYLHGRRLRIHIEELSSFWSRINAGVKDKYIICTSSLK